MYLRFELLTAEQARSIAGWRYPPPYEFYNADADPDDLQELLERSSPYYAALDPQDTLVGFFCFEQTARVPAGFAAGAYDDRDVLDVGLGMRPDLTGRGLGGPFLEAGLRFAREVFAPASFRITVATFNTRAIALYQRAGFRPTRAFINPTNRSEHEFLAMVRAAAFDPPVARTRPAE